jgi:chaperone BCS1
MIKKVLPYLAGLLTMILGSWLIYQCYINLEAIKAFGVSIYAWLNAQNPMIAGAISLWALATLSYISRSIPQKLWSILLKQSTVSLTMNNEDEVYTNFLVWYHNTGRSQKSRTLVAKNFWDNVNDRERLNISAGYGIHYFTFGGKIFKLSRELKENNQSKSVKESLTITTIGRSQKQFHSLIDIITPKETNKEVTSIYQWASGESYWHSYSQQPVRKFDSVILPEETKNKILTHIDNFLGGRKWYTEHGIPYRTGFDKPLYILSLSGTSDSSLEKALSSLPRDSLLLVEDIDTYSITSKRGGEESSDKNAISFLTLSGLLNAIDGIISSDGRILIATTNHLEKLDGALVRKGRFNLTVEIGYLTTECFIEFFKQFYSDFVIPKNTKFKTTVSPAELQALIMDNLGNPEYVLEECVVWKHNL